MAARKNENASANTKPADNNNVAVATETVEKKFPTTEQLIKDGFTTKSARIRELHRLGMATGDIARQETGGLYQHAYNVIKKPLKRKTEEASTETETESTTESTETSSKESEKVEA